MLYFRNAWGCREGLGWGGVGWGVGGGGAGIVTSIR